MENANLKSRGHSADVRIQLRLNGHVLSVAQLGPDFLILRKPAEHTPAQAEIAMSVDGEEERWPVYLTDGIQPGQVKTRIDRCR
jgi:hypothetical protein